MAWYRVLLRLLPRDRRRRHGGEMERVFTELTESRRATDGRLAVGQLWVAEIAGLLRFSLREWVTRANRAVSAVAELLGFLGHNGPSSFREVSWAWRGLRFRGWRGTLVVGLLALALAANSIVFAAADSFLFNRVPYRGANQLVELGHLTRFGWQPSVWPELVPVWRKQADLFADFQADDMGPRVYLTGDNDPRYVQSEEVTPGLFEMLGARPRWGRSFTADDVRSGAEPVVIVADELAAKEYGDARLAIGQKMLIDRRMVRIVGIMPSAFRFPSGQERIWTPLDLTTVPLHFRVGSIARAAPGQTLAAVSRAVGDRAPAFDSLLRPENQPRWKDPSGTWFNPGRSSREEARPIAPALVDPRLQRLFALLTAAAGCLLLVACANVINLELGASVARARTLAVSLALGASRATLIRTALFEGALAIAGATAAAAFLTWQVTSFIAAHLPLAMTNTLANPIRVDIRTLWFMAVVAAMTWLLASLPVAVRASRADVLEALKVDARTLSTSRAGARVRHVLTVGEVGLTVVLLLGASLNVITYRNLLNLPTGFDAARVVTVDVGQKPGSTESAASVQTRLLNAFKARPDVVAAAVAAASPPTMGGGIGGDLTVGSESTTRGQVDLGNLEVGYAYFRTLRLPIVSGRAFEPGDPPGSVVVDEAFARRFWQNGNAVGARFHVGDARLGDAAEMTIVGVAAHMRTDRDSVTEPSDSYFPVYLPLLSGSDYVPLSFVARVNRDGLADSIQSMVRALVPGGRVRVSLMTDRYAATFADEQLASSIMSAFGLVAFVVATVGVYGVMAFLVAARTREIGIRMALGADHSAVRRLVLATSMKPVIAGAGIGVLAAVAAAHWARSLYFGVATGTPVTFTLVALVVIMTAALATWQPARQAGRIDPSRLLRE